MAPDEYDELIRYARDRCGRRGIDQALEENDVDIIMGPGDGLMFKISGTAGQSPFDCFQVSPSKHYTIGYPVASLPLGYLDFNGRPFGLQIIAKAHQEALLVQAQSAWEATMAQRQEPPLDEIVG